MRGKRWLAALLAAALLWALGGCAGVIGGPDGPTRVVTGAAETAPATSFGPEETAPAASFVPEETADPKGNTPSLEEDGVYDSKEDVALYLHLYGCLPDNYITKEEARALGWNGGSVEDYAPGKCIGGDPFGNREGLLPEEKGRRYSECDIDTLGETGRGGERLVFSNDGLIYYTEDHYESFELLYGDP